MKSDVYMIGYGNVGIRDGKFCDPKGRHISDESAQAAAGFQLREEQKFSGGKLKIYRVGNTELKKLIYDDGRVEWVAMSAPANPATQRPRTPKISDSAKAGQTMFNPADYIAHK